jgi:hypothetical protein
VWSAKKKLNDNDVRKNTREHMLNVGTIKNVKIIMRGRVGQVAIGGS